MMSKIKEALRSRTIRVALVIAIVGVVEANLQLLAPLMSPQAYSISMSLIAGVFMVLRAVTTTPLIGGDRES